MSLPALQHQELLVTLFGSYSGPEGALKVSSLIALMSGLGIREGAVRSTVSRLKNREVLQRVGEGRPVSYRLSDSILDSFHADDQRIFAPERSRPGDPWALVVFSVPESERKFRYQLRTELLNHGFGLVAAGVAIAPVRLLDQVLTRLRKQGLDQYIKCFQVHYGDAERLAERVATWWDLAALDAQYSDFIATYSRELRRWKDLAAGGEPFGEARRAEAFALYIPLLTRWRRFPYRDPNIPLELLPSGWKAPQAKVLFMELHSILHQPAAEHTRHILAQGA